MVEGRSVLDLTSVVVNNGIAVQTGEVGCIGDLVRSEGVDEHEKSELGSATLLAEHVLVEQEVCAEEDNERLEVNAGWEITCFLQTRFRGGVGH